MTTRVRIEIEMSGADGRVVVECLDDGVRGGEQALAEEDEGEETVALGDVVRVPGSHAPLLGDDRHGELGGDEDDERDAARHRAE